MKTYRLVTDKVTRRSFDLEAIEQLVDHLPSNTPWRIERQFPGGRWHRLRSGVGGRLQQRAS